MTDNTWTETGITYSNAPTMGTQLSSSGIFSANAWTTVDVTSYITGNGSYNLAFSTTSNTNTTLRLRSGREGANAPELVIVTSGGATNTPTATNTPGPSPTPTNTVASTATYTLTAPPTATPTVPPPFQNATFVYDGDGRRVKSTINGTITTYFVGAHYEVSEGSGSTVTKYYYAGAQRIAMRTNGTLNFLLGDHLGSTSLAADSAGNKIYEQRYKAWGETRYTFGNPTTRYQYTGQFSYEAEFGLYFYNARWVDVSLGRFAQADSILDNPVTGWDRYSYVNNNPVLYTDPSGHKCVPEDECDKQINYFAQSANGRPDVLSRKTLSKGGNKLYDLYLKMYGDKSGWWWDEYGSGGFSIWEFMGIQWGLERDWYPNLEDYSETLSNGSAVWCQSKPTCSMTTAEWNMNFLAAYSQRPQSGVSNCVSNPSCDVESVVRRPSQGNSMQIVAAIQQRLPLSVDPVGPQDLYSVGNVSLSSDILMKMIKRGMVYNAWGSGNTMVMLKKCESDLYGYASANNGTRDINKANYSKFCG